MAILSLEKFKDFSTRYKSRQKKEVHMKFKQTQRHVKSL